MLSAQLDGEDDPADRERVDEHLAGCADCREWLDRAATVNRLTRTSVVTEVPDLSAAIMAAVAAQPAPPSRVSARFGWLTRARAATALYLGLAVIGAVQLILGLGQVGGGQSGEHVHAGVDAAAGHLWHESAAWNVAVGAGYLFIALRRSRPAGLVPMLTAFVAMLLLLSVNDLTADRVDGARLVSHGFVILGYLLIVALSRVAPETARPPGAHVDGGSGWRARFEDDDEPAEPAALVPGLRLVPRGPLTAGPALDQPGRYPTFAPAARIAGPATALPYRYAADLGFGSSGLGFGSSGWRAPAPGFVPPGRIAAVPGFRPPRRITAVADCAPPRRMTAVAGFAPPSRFTAVAGSAPPSRITAVAGLAPPRRITAGSGLAAEDRRAA